MNIVGKVIGSIFGGLLTSNILGITLGGVAGHFLFDYKNIIAKKEEEISDNFYYDNIDIFNNIIKLCYSLINIKGNILIGEIDSIKYFFKNEFRFDKKEIKLIDDTIYNLSSNNIKINYDEIINGINSYCKYEEKIMVVQLLFFLAISDMRITEEESHFIFNATQKLNIQSSDYIKIKNLFVPDEENYYTILKIDENATNIEIKAAYRKMANLHHPDKHRDGDYNKEEFQKVVRAYQEIKKIRKF